MKTQPAAQQQTPVPTEVLSWLVSGDTGLSSMCIVQVLTRAPAPAEWYMRGAYPHDPSDFGRCARLLAKVTGWEERLPEVATVFPMWGPLVREWSALKALYFEELPNGTAPKLSARMKELEQEARA